MFYLIKKKIVFLACTALIGFSSLCLYADDMSNDASFCDENSDNQTVFVHDGLAFPKKDQTEQPLSHHLDDDDISNHGNYRIADYHFFINSTNRFVDIYVGDFIPTSILLRPGQSRIVFMSTRNQTIEIRDIE